MNTVAKGKLLIFTILAGFCLPFQALAAPAKDREAVAFLLAANQHEISVAKSILKKAHNGQVIDFANLMITEHGKNLQETKNISHKQKIAALETKEIKKLKQEGEKEKATLQNQTKAFLERAYIDAMVTGHKDVLEKIDLFIPQIHNKTLKNHLLATRVHVANHLEKARKIQLDFQGNRP